MQLIFRYIKPYKGRFIATFVVKFFGTIIDLIIPWILAHLIDVVVPTGNIRQIMLWGIGMVISALLGYYASVRANKMTAQSAALFAEDLRNDVFEKALSLSHEQIHSLGIASLISRVTNDTYTIHSFVSLVQRMGSRAPILLVGSVLITFTLDPKLALIMLCMMPALAFIIVTMTRRGVPLFDQSRSLSDGLVRVLRENVLGARVIKALDKGSYEQKRFDSTNCALKDSTCKAEGFMALSNPLIGFVLNVGMVLVLIFGAHYIARGVSTPGTLITFITYFSIIATSMLTVTRVFIMSSKSIASAKRLEGILNLQSPESSDDVSCESFAESMGENHIEFKNVSFSYLKKRNNLQNLSFAVKKGETLAILGGIGSGKSTIINLLLGFYSPDVGEILINGIPVRELSREKLSKMMGVVFQKEGLLQSDIYQNIDFGRGIPERDIVRACEHAQAMEFIDQKEGGLRHAVAIGGKNLSGGQRQRVLIARALATTPEILLLDDASGALDYQTDRMLRKGLTEHYAQSTKIIISQRISSIYNAQQIILLEDGKIVGLGTHQKLLSTCAQYKNIYNSQGGDC